MLTALLSRLRWLAAGRSGTSAVAQTVLARAGMLFGNIFTGIIIARTLQPTGRGEQAAIMLWPVLISSFLTLGLPPALVYNIRREPHREREFFSVALVATLVLGIVAALVGLLIVPHALYKYPPWVIVDAQAMMIFAPQPICQYVVQAVLEARGAFSVSNRLRFLPLILTLLSLGILALIHRLTPLTGALSYLVPSTVLTLTTLVQIGEVFPLRFPAWKTTSQQLFSYGIKCYGNDVIGTFSLQVEQGLLVGLLSPAQLGIFTVGVSVARILNIFHASIVTVLFPKAASLTSDEVVAMTGRSARIGNAVAVLGAVLLTVIVPLLLPFMYGKSFANAIVVVRLLSIEVILSGTTFVLAQAFMATGRPATITLFQAVGLGVSAPLLIVLIPRYGLAGAALAFVLSTATRFALVLVAYPLLLHKPMPGLVITLSDLRFLRHRVALGKSPKVTTSSL